MVAPIKLDEAASVAALASMLDAERARAEADGTQAAQAVVDAQAGERAALDRAEAAEAMLAELREAAAALVPMGQGLTPEAARVVALLASKVDATAASYRARVEAEVLEAMEAKMREASKNALEDSRGSGGSIATGRHFAWERAAELLETEAVKRKRGAR